MRAALNTFLSLSLLGVFAPQYLHCAEQSNVELEQTFTQTVRPFVASYCVQCHGGKSPAAKFNLAAYTATADVIRDLPHWNAVAGRLKAEQMPPKGMKQPPPDLRAKVINWIQAVRWAEARKHAGDP